MHIAASEQIIVAFLCFARLEGFFLAIWGGKICSIINVGQNRAQFCLSSEIDENLMYGNMRVSPFRVARRGDL